MQDARAAPAPSGIPGKRTLTEGLGPTIHDAAALAVEHKDAGRAVPDPVRAPVEAHLGTDLSRARVHDDQLAQEATSAMGARAFAYRDDVFLGPGESEHDRKLMAHELTHVAQQSTTGARIPQMQIQVGDPHSAAEGQADAVAAAVTEGDAVPAALLVDAGPLQPGQMLKSIFLAQLRPQVTAAATEELGPFRAVAGCPYIDRYFARYATEPAAHGEAMLRRFVPAIRGVRSAADIIPLAVARIREGVRIWRDTGRPPRPPPV